MSTSLQPQAPSASSPREGRDQGGQPRGGGVLINDGVEIGEEPLSVDLRRVGKDAEDRAGIDETPPPKWDELAYRRGSAEDGPERGQGARGVGGRAADLARAGGGEGLDG